MGDKHGSGTTGAASRAASENAAVCRRVFLDSPAVRLIIEPSAGSILDANRAALAYYGYTLAELRALTIYQINVCPPAEIARVIALAGERCCKAVPFRHRLKDGSVRDVEVYSCPVDVAGQQLLHSIIIDVSARVAAEEALRESRERLELVVQGAKAGIWDWDLRTGRVLYDKQWKAILGYDEDELDGDFAVWIDRWHPEDSDKITEAMEAYLAGRTEKYEVEYRLRHKDGSYRWIVTNGKVTRDGAGRPIRWTGCNVDVTDYKKTKALYLESERLLRDFADAVPDVSFIIDEDGRFLEVFGNGGNFQEPKQAFVGRSVHDMLPREAADFLLSEVRLAIASRSLRVGVRELRLGTRKRHYSGRAVPLGYTVAGKRTAAVIAVDITEQQRTRKALQLTYELRRRSDYINDILGGRAARDEDAAFISARIGLDINAPLVVFLLLDPRFDLNGRCPEDAGLSGVQKLRDGVIDALGAIPDCVAWDCREGIGVLFPAKFRADEGERTREIAARLKTLAREYEPRLELSVGISDIHAGVGGLRTGARQALSAALSARSRLAGGADTVHYREAGIFQFLPCPPGGEAARDYVEQHLGRLIAHDRAKQTNYLETLEDLLRGASLRETAQRQHLHIKSVVFRQKSIAKILNIDLGDYKTRQALTLALQLHKLHRP